MLTAVCYAPGRSSNTESVSEKDQGRVEVQVPRLTTGEGDAPSPSAPPPMATLPRSTASGFLFDVVDSVVARKRFTFSQTPGVLFTGITTRPRPDRWGTNAGA